MYGVPVIFGPNYKKFKEARDLIECGGSFTISTKEEYEEIMRQLSDEKFREASGAKAGEYINRNTGATSQVVEEIFLK